MAKKKCPYCGQYQGLTRHSCPQREKVLATAPKIGLWRSFRNALTGSNKVQEGVNPDIAANRHRRINEGGAFPFSTSVDTMHDKYMRRRLEPQVGQSAVIRNYEGDRRGTVTAIEKDRIQLEFPPRRQGEPPIKDWYPTERVYGDFDPEDVNTRPIRPQKDPSSLGVIKKNSRVTVAYYDQDVKGTVVQVRGTIVDYLPDGETQVKQVSASLCSLLPE